jgi:signal transduction histidine kinase
MEPVRLSLASRWRSLARLLGYLAVEACWALASVGVLVVVVLTLPLLALGLGRFVVPWAADLLDRVACRANARAARVLGIAACSRRDDLTGPVTAEDVKRIIASPTTRRQLGWLLVHATLVLAVTLISWWLVIDGAITLLTPAYWWMFPATAPVNVNFAVTSWPLAFFGTLLGVFYALLVWFVVPWLARRVASSTIGILTPRHYAELATRITALSTSRAAALAAHSAELRRIERELHDGAQNRLLGVVMMLGMAHRAFETDPASALPFIEKAQDAASGALAELRNAVHDVYPPVLDELGLAGAASTLAGRSVIPVVLEASGLRRAPAAVEAAAYFVVAEALSNVAKHAQAKHASVTLHTERSADQDVLVIEVTDDGKGGATADGEGTGLAGIARRAAAFEGALTVESPVGGPTTVRVELPCGF